MLSKKTLKSRYEAESPDELALVKAVCNYGCRLLSRTNDYVSIFIPTQDKVTFKVRANFSYVQMYFYMYLYETIEVIGHHLACPVRLYPKGMSKLDLSSHLLEIPNNGYMPYSHIFIGCSLLCQECFELIG